MQTQTQAGPKTFFSSAAALVVGISAGQRVTDAGGVSKVVGQKVAEFTPIGDGFGRLITDDPETIEKLEARMRTSSDVFEAAEYNRRTTPVEMRLKMAEQENARLVENNNRLLAKLNADASQEKRPSK